MEGMWGRVSDTKHTCVRMHTRSHPHMDFCDAVSSECAGQTSGMRVIPGWNDRAVFLSSFPSQHTLLLPSFILPVGTSLAQPLGVWFWLSVSHCSPGPGQHSLWGSHGCCSIATPGPLALASVEDGAGQPARLPHSCPLGLRSTKLPRQAVSARRCPGEHHPQRCCGRRDTL